jgi:hypothetical protein
LPQPVHQAHLIPAQINVSRQRSLRLIVHQALLLIPQKVFADLFLAWAEHMMQQPEAALCQMRSAWSVRQEEC